MLDLISAAAFSLIKKPLLLKHCHDTYVVLQLEIMEVGKGRSRSGNDLHILSLESGCDQINDILKFYLVLTFEETTLVLKGSPFEAISSKAAPFRAGCVIVLLFLTYLTLRSL